MKTSELKRIVEENGYEFQKTNQFIFIRFNDFKIMGLDLHDHSVVLYPGTYLVTNQIKRIMVALIEYSLTPLNEREDERKYAFELWHKANLSMETKYLKFDKKLELYYLNKNQVENSQFQRIFTQSEIDNFPKEIKGAIECGFLRKVEVE